MKKVFLILFVSVTLSYAQAQSTVLQGFIADLSSSNVKLRGELVLFGKYKGDLSTLTYEAYYEALKLSVKKSNKDVADLVNKSDKRYFIATRNSFTIVLYNKKMNAVICDNASTAFVDSVLVIKDKENIPELKTLIR